MLEPDCSRHISDYENAGNNNGLVINLSLNDRLHMTDTTLDYEKTIDLPEGTYAAHIIGVRSLELPSGKKDKDWLCMGIKITAPSISDEDLRCYIKYHVSFYEGSNLREFLTKVLGPDFFNFITAKSFDLNEILPGIRGVIKLIHLKSEGRDKPMVIVKGFKPSIKEWLFLSGHATRIEALTPTSSMNETR